jgi:3-oxoacyl-[acyl-carrier-protein] synthase II
MKRVVITGIGACTSVGDNAQECFSSFLEGKMGNKALVHLNEKHFNNKVAYERTEPSNKNGKFRSSSFVKSSLLEAINQAGIDTKSDIPVYVGTGLRELRSAEISALSGETISVSDLDFTNAINEILPACTRIYTLSNACAASNFALALAYDSISLGHSNIAIACGCDTLTASMFGLLDRANSSSPKEVQVFDKSRKGVLMGDGGVAIVIEDLETVLNEGRIPLAELKGVGLGSDATHETAPDKEGIKRALDDAYCRCRIKAEDVDLIYVHGTGTELNDATESSVLNDVYNKIEKKPALAGIKSMTGHTSGASGGIGVASAVLSLQQQLIPPTPGTKNVLDDVKNFPIYEKAIKNDLNVVQVNAFGFGGVNAVVMVQRYVEGAS